VAARQPAESNVPAATYTMNSGITSRRLAQLVTALVPVPTVVGVHDGAPRFRGGTANGLGFLVEQDPATGVVSEAALLPVAEAKMAAVAVEDYALAGHLNQVIKVLHPANRLTPVSQRLSHHPTQQPLTPAPRHRQCASQSPGLHKLRFSTSTVL
jgi:hypothetical protein